MQVSDETKCNDERFIEKPPSNLQVGIKVDKLTKKYGRDTAVEGLNMKIYKNQITVLLGHNGAGKTTTMSMITGRRGKKWRRFFSLIQFAFFKGMIRATEGRILIDGRDIRDNTSEIQSSFGLCPQHNLLFTDLTVMEHLIFFGVVCTVCKKSICTPK